MSTEKRSEKRVEDEANLRARNPNASKQKISESQSAPEFEENHKRLRAERLSREAVEGPVLYPLPNCQMTRHSTKCSFLPHFATLFRPRAGKPSAKSARLLMRPF